MSHDPFASSTVSLILSWIASIPVFCGVIQYLIYSFQKQEGVRWLFSAWVGLCFLILSPIRYIFFMAAAASSYPFQSAYAFISVIWWIIAWCGLHLVVVAIAWSILWFFGYVGPFLLVGLIAGMRKTPTKLRYCAAGILAPILALIGSCLFTAILPFTAAATTHGLPAEDVIRATNGPAYYVFGYTVPRMLVALPPYAADMPATTKDLLRAHVAWLYLSNKEHARFAKQAYPDLDVTFPEGKSRRPSNELAGAN